MVAFKAKRSDPELVPPALPTPRETKALSHIDTQPALRFYAAGVEFFRRRPIVDDVHDPPKVVKDAVAKALTYYYPVAGRIHELPGGEGELVVECTGEGVVFVEANADVTLDELGDPLVPPYPCVDEFFCDPGDTSVVIGKPLVFMQVTKLKCGGFVIGTYSCHNIVDAFGHTQFLKAIADIARGDDHPTVLPVWGRELMAARNPPNIDVTCLQHYSICTNIISPLATEDDMVGEYFVFGPREITALQHHAAQLSSSTTAFEVITAALWRCRTVALGHHHQTETTPTSLLMTMNARGKWKHDPPLPQGFYGNGFVYLVVEADADELRNNSLGYAVELVQKAKLNMTEEFARSMVDFIALHGGPPYVPGWTFVVSDITRIGEDALDFGWAQRVGGGVPMIGDVKCKQVSYQMRCINGSGEDCVVASMFLPKPAMEVFAKEILMLSKEID